MRQQSHELAHPRRVVVPGAGADKIAVHDHLLIEIARTTRLGVETPFLDRRDPASLAPASRGNDLDAGPPRRDWRLPFVRLPHDAKQIGIVAQVLWSAPAGKDDARIVCLPNV